VSLKDHSTCVIRVLTLGKTEVTLTLRYSFDQCRRRVNDTGEHSDEVLDDPRKPGRQTFLNVLLA